VLDPACGSGNFLYVALAGLKDLEKEVDASGAANGLPAMLPRTTSRSARCPRRSIPQWVGTRYAMRLIDGSGGLAAFPADLPVTD
jgi:MmeI, DNA-methyltransferase domain